MENVIKLSQFFLWAAAISPLLGMSFLMYLNKKENGSIFAVKDYYEKKGNANSENITGSNFSNISKSKILGAKTQSKAAYYGSISGGGA